MNRDKLLIIVGSVVMVLVTVFGIRQMTIDNMAVAYSTNVIFMRYLIIRIMLHIMVAINYVIILSWFHKKENTKHLLVLSATQMGLTLLSLVNYLATRSMMGFSYNIIHTPELVHYGLFIVFITCVVVEYKPMYLIAYVLWVGYTFYEFITYLVNVSIFYALLNTLIIVFFLSSRIVLFVISFDFVKEYIGELKRKLKIQKT